MNGEPFTLDTNILVYAFDADSGSRHVQAKAVVQRATQAPCWLTLQAVSEFYAAVTRKRLMAPTDARRYAEAMLEAFPQLAPSPATLRKALATAASGRASYWDALLVATAAEGGCRVILTEDLATGASLDGVRIVNPFGADDLTPEAVALLTA
jgi:predicted nucleic acid-binding protein